MKHEPKYLLAIYVEGCNRAGERCYDDDMIERRSDDLEIHEFASDAELREFAARLGTTRAASLFEIRRRKTVNNFAYDVLAPSQSNDEDEEA